MAWLTHRAHCQVSGSVQTVDNLLEAVDIADH